MAKTAKKTADRDLFDSASSSRRLPSKPVRGKRRAGRCRLHGARHRGAGRARAGAPPPRHVYRRHRREGAASPVRRGDRQRDGRGARRPRRLDRRERGGRRLRHGGRQRARHAGRSASEVPEKIRARSDHVHAARGRQIRLQGLRDLGRPAWRRRLGRERALGAHGGRGRARRQALRAWRSSAASRRASSRSSAARRTGAAPRCASSPTRRSSAPRPRSSRRACSRWRARRPICSAASRSAGPATRRCSRASTTCRSRRPSTSSAG